MLGQSKEILSQKSSHILHNGIFLITVLRKQNATCNDFIDDFIDISTVFCQSIK